MATGFGLTIYLSGLAFGEAHDESMILHSIIHSSTAIAADRFISISKEPTSSRLARTGADASHLFRSRSSIRKNPRTRRKLPQCRLPLSGPSRDRELQSPVLSRRAWDRGQVPAEQNACGELHVARAAFFGVSYSQERGLPWQRMNCILKDVSREILQ